MSMKTTSWHEAVAEKEAAGDAYVLATIFGAVGSTPRDSGSKMLICSEHSYDSIGGGQLEFLVIQEARAMLAQQETHPESPRQHMKQFSLAAEARQCCGGAVTVLFEHFASKAKKISIFGAGHVTHALVKILAELPVKVSCIDTRQELLDNLPAAANLKKICSTKPEQLVAQIGPQSYSLILTHDHALDYRLVCAFLDLELEHYQLGLIGSQIKADKFRRRLIREGYPHSAIEQLRSPVGLAEVKGKHPMEVALSIAAEFVALTAEDTPPSQNNSTNWKEMKQAIALAGEASDS